jgi:ABC-type branched-subunit amino acid transport system substrate-binding protein
MQQFRAFLAALSISVCAICSAAAPASNENSPVIVGQAVDLSGPNADFGRDYSFGAKLYFDYANGNGGINGRRIVYRSLDSAGTASGGLTAARTLVADGSSVLFGINGDDVIEAVARDAGLHNSGVTIFGAVGGSSQLGAKDGVFYLRAGTAQEIEAMVAHLAPLGIRSISLASTGEYAREAGDALDEAARRYGVRVLARQRFDIAGDGPAKAAQNIARDQPQAVIVAADTLAVAQFFKRYRSLDQGAFLCTTSLVNVRTLIAITGLQAAHGLIVSQVVPNPAGISEITREHKKLMDRLADEPASYATFEGFMAAKVLVQTLRRSHDSGRNAIQQTLQKEGRFDLGGYELNFGKGSRASNFVELTVVGRNGQLLH